MAETFLEDVKLKIGTEAQFQEKLKDLPIGTLVGTTDPIDKGDLSTDIINSLAKADSALPQPTNQTTGSAGQVLTKTASGSEWKDVTNATIYSSDVKWGGANITDKILPIDAAFLPAASVNRLMSVTPNAITIEYSRDGGTTWLDYGATDIQKVQLFTNWADADYFRIGKADSDWTVASSDSGDNMLNAKLRVTIDNTIANLYAQIEKVIMWTSVAGNSECYSYEEVSADGETWTKVDGTDTHHTGWPGAVVTNFNPAQVWGSNDWSKKKVRFVFESRSVDIVSGGESGFGIDSIAVFGSTCWDAPSYMAKNGVPYIYNWNGDITLVKALYTDKGRRVRAVEANPTTDATATLTKLSVDGTTYSVPQATTGVEVVQATGTSTTAVMSQKATTDALKNEVIQVSDAVVASDGNVTDTFTSQFEMTGPSLYFKRSATPLYYKVTDNSGLNAITEMTLDAVPAGVKDEIEYILAENYITFTNPYKIEITDAYLAWCDNLQEHSQTSISVDLSFATPSSEIMFWPIVNEGTEAEPSWELQVSTKIYNNSTLYDGKVIVHIPKSVQTAYFFLSTKRLDDNYGRALTSDDATYFYNKDDYVIRHNSQFTNWCSTPFATVTKDNTVEEPNKIYLDNVDWIETDMIIDELDSDGYPMNLMLKVTSINAAEKYVIVQSCNYSIVKGDILEGLGVIPVMAFLTEDGNPESTTQYLLPPLYRSLLGTKVTANPTDSATAALNTIKIDKTVYSIGSDKQAALSEAQLNAVNSGVTAAKVSKYDGYESTINGKYTKPSAGIPKSDLAAAVQTSLGKADTALQEHQSLDGKQDKLVSGTNIKTINSTSILGSGDILTPNQKIAVKPDADHTWTYDNNYTIYLKAGNNISFTSTTDTVTINATGGGTTDLSNYVDKTSAQTISGAKTFSAAITANGGVTAKTLSTTDGTITSGSKTYTLPSSTGTVALTSDIKIKSATLSGTTLTLTI